MSEERLLRALNGSLGVDVNSPALCMKQIGACARLCVQLAIYKCSSLSHISFVAGTVRSVIRRNYFLVAHHILYFVFFLVPIVRDSVWGSKVRF